MARRGLAKTIGLVLVAVVVLGFIAYNATRPVIGWPSESRRAVHPGGFSVVIPPDWEKHVVLADDRQRAMLQSLPSKPVGNPGTFNVTRLVERPTAEDLAQRGYTATTFQNKPAFEKWKVDKVELEHARSVVFERDGIWFDMTIRRSQVEPLDRGAWRQYAETFRVEPVRTLPTIHFGRSSTAPAPRPATAPTS